VASGSPFSNIWTNLLVRRAAEEPRRTRLVIGEKEFIFSLEKFNLLFIPDLLEFWHN
jgi:hypothetical protein